MIRAKPPRTGASLRTCADAIANRLNCPRCPCIGRPAPTRSLHATRPSNCPGLGDDRGGPAGRHRGLVHAQSRHAQHSASAGRMVAGNVGLHRRNCPGRHRRLAVAGRRRGSTVLRRRFGGPRCWMDGRQHTGDPDQHVRPSAHSDRAALERTGDQYGTVLRVPGGSYAKSSGVTWSRNSRNFSTSCSSSSRMTMDASVRTSSLA